MLLVLIIIFFPPLTENTKNLIEIKGKKKVFTKKINPHYVINDIYEANKLYNRGVIRLYCNVSLSTQAFQNSIPLLPGSGRSQAICSFSTLGIEVRAKTSFADARFRILRGRNTRSRQLYFFFFFQSNAVNEAFPSLLRAP
ncbi:hypothetical protein PUN28_003195 [Cardiocondyla obscurior]|uniref:Uncharacterized protein n=1 Tax=Cardiocondyla obscurior TaxID=286306 RepID=A0AAW2GHS9_9HYME